MGTIADKLRKLLETKTAIKNAIISKGQPVEDSDTFASYPAKIEAIQTGVDTSDADATAADIAQGKTAYVNGEKVTGTVQTIESGHSGGGRAARIGKGVATGVPVVWGYDDHLVPVLYRAGSSNMIGIALEDLGDASASDVVAGKTFTSTAGLKTTGTIQEYSTGNIVVSNGSVSSGSSPDTSGQYVNVIYIEKEIGQSIVGRKGSYVLASSPASNFGDATAADVAYGKTFTSAAGLKVLGTAMGGGQYSSVVINNWSDATLYVGYSQPGITNYCETSISSNTVVTLSVARYSILYITCSVRYEIGSSEFTGVTSPDGDTRFLIFWVNDSDCFIRVING